MMSVMAKVMMLIVISWGGTLAAPTLLALRTTQEKQMIPRLYRRNVRVSHCELMEVTGGQGVQRLV